MGGEGHCSPPVSSQARGRFHDHVGPGNKGCCPAEVGQQCYTPILCAVSCFAAPRRPGPKGTPGSPTQHLATRTEAHRGTHASKLNPGKSIACPKLKDNGGRPSGSRRRKKQAGALHQLDPCSHPSTGESPAHRAPRGEVEKVGAIPTGHCVERAQRQRQQ